MFLGHPINRNSKGGRDNSLSEKQRAGEGTENAALQGPRDKAKARLLEVQSQRVLSTPIVTVPENDARCAGELCDFSGNFRNRGQPAMSWNKG